MPDEKDESTTRADEPATEAIPQQGAPRNEDGEPDVAPAAETAEIPPVTSSAAAESPRARAKPHAAPRRIEPRVTNTARPAPQAAPQRVGPPPEQSGGGRGGRRWISALILAVVVIVAVGVAGFVYLSGDSEDTSPETRIRTSLTSFTEALTSGDLATLRSSSCGELATYYQGISDAEFADVHRAAVEQGNIPVVDAVDAVQITGDTAIAQVIAYTAANPNERSPRTFDLRLEGEEWKVC